MLEYFAYKKFKKNKAEKESARAEAASVASAPLDRQRDDDATNRRKRPSRTSSYQSSLGQPHTDPVLDARDEAWIQSLINDDDGPAPPLPPRVKTPEVEIGTSDSDAALSRRHSEENSKKDKSKSKKDKKSKNDKNKEEKQPGRLSLLFSKHKKQGDTLSPSDIPPQEAEREKNDLTNVLSRLNLSAKNNKVISLSNESSDLLQRFTQVFKDLVNGAPTAYNDLVNLIEDRDGALNKGFSKLPSSLQKLVTQLPDKLTSTLAPEILAAAAESQGIKATKDKGIKEAAKSIFMPQNLTQLVTKPGAIVSMLKAIVNALRVRWPAFIGTNVLWSVALFLLMFVLWYCHKRGREVRLENESAASAIDGSSRIEELPDDPALPAPEPRERPFARSRTEPVIETVSSSHPRPKRSSTKRESSRSYY